MQIQKSYNCGFEGCDSEFNRLDHLIMHERTHSGERPFCCDFEGCDRKFSQTSNLMTHKKIHSDLRPYLCDFKGCDGKFKSSSGLRSHKKIHSDSKPFLCTFKDCESKFYRSEHLVIHQRIHTNERPYSCSYENCESKFSHSTSLKAHERTHLDEKSFQCDFKGCEQKFKERSTLTIHKRIHSGDRPYCCNHQGCDYKCTTSGNLINHRKSMHTSEGEQRQKKEEEAVAKAFTAAGISYKREHQIDMSCIANKENHFIRLDFLIIEDGILRIIEIDENQHRGYPVLCDSIRPWKIAETLAIEGNTLPIIVIRFNPSAYKVDGKLQKISKKDRYQELIKLVNSSDEKELPPLSVHYMYYDLDKEGRVEVTKDPDFHQETVNIIVK